jgi:preprotein translocase subunit YajC
MHSDSNDWRWKLNPREIAKVMVYTVLMAAGNVMAAATQAPGAGQPAGPKPQGPNLLGAMTPFLIIFVIFYFLIIAPQRKQTKETEKMLAALKRGDRVVTSGGIHGTIVDLREADKTASLEVAPGVRMTVSRSAIASVKREGSLPAAK